MSSETRRVVRLKADGTLIVKDCMIVVVLVTVDDTPVKARNGNAEMWPGSRYWSARRAKSLRTESSMPRNRISMKASS